MRKLIRCALTAVVFIASFAVQMPARAEKPMDFYVDSSEAVRLYAELMEGGVKDIYASGEITEGTAARLEAFVKKHNIKAAKIHFNSPGGLLFEGIKLGELIRNLGFFTTVGSHIKEGEPNNNPSSICASSCAYAFAGGVSRFLTKYTGRLGVHQFYTDSGVNTSSGRVQKISAMIVAYLTEMGVDARAFVISSTADKDGIVWLDPDSALKLNFANNGSTAPVAEIKLSGMDPYLRVEQDHHTGTTRVLFICQKNGVISIGFGNVTNPTNAAAIAGNSKRSYFELDGKEILPIQGDSGIELNDSTVWIQRQLTPALLVGDVSEFGK